MCCKVLRLLHTIYLLIIFLNQHVLTCLTRPARVTTERKLNKGVCASEFSPGAEMIPPADIALSV